MSATRSVLGAIDNAGSVDGELGNASGSRHFADRLGRAQEADRLRAESTVLRRLLP
jgi:hypothetical protein